MIQSLKIDHMIDWSKEPDIDTLSKSYNLLLSNDELALDNFKILANQGSIMSMVYLGYAYNEGKVTKSDYLESERWYRQAVVAGSVLAEYGLGRLFLKSGRPVEARQYFELAANKGYVPAIHFLGRIYFYGQGVPKDIEKATELLERAASGGSVFAQRILGQILVQKNSSFLKKLRGVWLIVSAAAVLTIIICINGFSSDRFR